MQLSWADLPYRYATKAVIEEAEKACRYENEKSGKSAQNDPSAPGIDNYASGTANSASGIDNKEKRACIQTVYI